MAVLRLTSKKTLPILLQALSKLSFTQTELAASTATSIGRVNKVITYLKEKDIINKEQGRYVITKPNWLADLIAAQQGIDKRRTYHVSESKEKLQKECAKRGITLCLQTALERYDREQTSTELHCIDSEAAKEYLDSLPRGEQQVNLYAYDTTTVKSEATDPIRTIIDLKSANNGQRAEALAQKLWRTRQ